MRWRNQRHHRHCEERSDEAIQPCFVASGLLPPSLYELRRTSRFARNDGDSLFGEHERMSLRSAAARSALRVMRGALQQRRLEGDLGVEQLRDRAAGLGLAGQLLERGLVGAG